jgi:uncharacterized protein (TIGR02246 family)
VRKTPIVFVVLLAALAGACSPKVNSPADIEAVKATVEAFGKAMNAGDPAAMTAAMTDKTVYADNHFPVAVGAEAVKAMYTAVTSQFSTEFQVPVDEVRVAGDLAVARGTWTMTMTPKTPGLAPIKDRGSWMLTASRQADGSWKWDAVVPNSDQALPGATSDGAAEQAIAAIENSFGEVMTKGDVAAAEQVLANEWVEHGNGGVTTRAQVLGAMKSGAVKVESATVRDLRIAVFGDAAVATMIMEVKGSFMGKPFPASQRGTDFFVKRDGRWQIVNTQNTAVQ